MDSSSFRRALKPWILPLAMVIGAVFHSYIGAIAFLSPYLIFIMLLITFCRVDLSAFRITPMVWLLLAVQVGGAAAAYVALLPLGEDVAQGAFICIFCPTATAAPVVTGMLGGSVERLATYSLVSNVVVAVLAPVSFAVIGHGADIGFVTSMLTISMRVLPLILAPLALALLLRVYVPSAHRRLSEHQSLSFYLWAVALIIVVGNAVSFVMREPAGRIPEMMLIAGVSLVACCMQFVVGRMVGRRYGDRISGAQALGQKNTVLAIWMALTYLSPISSVGPAAYVAWQNIINSSQLYFKARRDGRAADVAAKTF